jgi:flagellin-like hook-associated protein FlgL
MGTGKRINSSADGGVDIAVSQTLASAVKRNDAVNIGIQNTQSYLETQQGALKVLSDIVSRMRVLHTQYKDITKNDTDRENYNYEFKELTKQISVLSREKFNGVSIFSSLTDYISGASDLNVTIDKSGTQKATYKRPVLEGTLIDNILLYGADKGLAVFDKTDTKQKDTFTISGSIAKDDVFSFKFEYADIQNGQHISETITYTATAADEASADPKQTIRDALVNLASAKIASVATISTPSSNTFSIEANDTSKVFITSGVSSSYTKAEFIRTTKQENISANTITLDPLQIEANATYTIEITDKDGTKKSVTTSPIAAGATLKDVRDALITAINGTTGLSVQADVGATDAEIKLRTDELVQSTTSGMEIIVAVDISGSASGKFANPNISVGDFNSDGRKDTVVDVELFAINELVQYLKTNNPNAKLSLYGFGGLTYGQSEYDMLQNTAAHDTLVPLSLDGDIESTLRKIRSSARSNYLSASTSSIFKSIFSSGSSDPNTGRNLIFLGNGIYNSDTAINDLRNAPYNVNVRALTIPSTGGSRHSTHVAIDKDAILINSPQELVDLFRGSKSGFQSGAVTVNLTSGTTTEAQAAVAEAKQVNAVTFNVGTVSVGASYTMNVDAKAITLTMPTASSGSGAFSTTTANKVGISHKHTVTFCNNPVFVDDVISTDIDGTTVSVTGFAIGTTINTVSDTSVAKFNTSGLEVTAGDTKGVITADDTLQYQI